MCLDEYMRRYRSTYFIQMLEEDRPNGIPRRQHHNLDMLETHASYQTPHILSSYYL